VEKVKRASIPPAGLLLLGLLSLGWGFNWPIMKLVVVAVPPMIFRGLCLVPAAFGLFAIVRLSGQPLRVPPGRWGQMAALALTNVVGWNIFATYGVSLLPSGRAAILGYTMPLWSMLLSRWLLDEPLTRRRIVGLLLGMAAMGLLLAAELGTLGSAPWGVLFMLVAAFCWGLGVVLYKRAPIDMPISALTAWQMLLGGVPILAAGLLFEPVDWGAVGEGPRFGLVYNVFVAFLFCYWAWNRLVQMLPVAVSSLGSLIIPVVGVFSGMAILGERPHWQDFAALLLVLGALASVIAPARR
jgi:drug/metabolite transporter (DMT)-like permease